MVCWASGSARVCSHGIAESWKKRYFPGIAILAGAFALGAVLLTFAAS